MKCINFYRIFKIIQIFGWFIISLRLTAQTSHTAFVIQPEDLNNPAYAEWITHPEITGKEYGVYYFRKEITIRNKPDQYIIHISADNRYTLYINNKQACFGPAVGDLYNWQYETVDITDYLEKGSNIIAVRVCNYGTFAGSRQISNRTALIVQGTSKDENEVNTNDSWKVYRDTAYFPLQHTSANVGGGYIAGCTDSLVGEQHPWDWKEAGFNDRIWQNARSLGKGIERGLNTWLGTPWLLKERIIPPMEQHIERIAKGYPFDDDQILLEDSFSIKNIMVPENSTRTWLIDQKYLTMGFPVIEIWGGKGATIRLQYQEKLFNKDGSVENRNILEHKIMKGYYDIFITDGGERKFEPLWIRTFRFIKLTVTTNDEPLQIKDFYNIFTAYPFQRSGGFTSNNPLHEEIQEISWRTARLCALETYMDCPYYEQMQYIGDTRLQALISLYITGDHRLMKNALMQFNASRIPEGLTKSSHPSDGRQVIPPFTLVYIQMVHDYFMHRDDPEFIKSLLPGIRFSLEWFINKIDESGMLGPLPYWNHIDGGTKEFPAGAPPGTAEGKSAHMTIYLSHAMDKAIAMFQHFQMMNDVVYLVDISNRLKAAAYQYCYDEQKGLISETPEKELFSQHTNAIAILADIFPENEQKTVARKIVSDSTLAHATLYYQFYIFQALKKAGLGALYLNQLKAWEDMLDYGFSTWPEHGKQSRSDCHAWGSHPLYDFLQITCGIEPAEPGFMKVLINPSPGDLTDIKGTVVHPLGLIETKFNKNIDGTWNISIVLPPGLFGRLVWGEKRFPLVEGEQVYGGLGLE